MTPRTAPALREHGLIPSSPFATYEEYLDAMGGSAAEKARGLPPGEVLDEVLRSGLRGRGGAGFPTGVKWRTLMKHPCPTRFVVCNAAEGEPGTFKDRHLLRKNPYATIEGLLIAAHVIGARAGYVGIKASFRTEIDRLRHALDEMKEAGVLGEFPITIVEGPEEYLFGEEKALLEVIEGNAPLPRIAEEPPYEVGLFATEPSPNPALVNNAETFAHVATIVKHGAESFRELGTHDTPGTIVVTLSGDLAKPGVYEVEAGVPLRSLLYEVGGGALPGRSFKAVLSGVSSGVIVPEQFDAPADFGSLALIGSGLGSAGFIVFDDRRSMPRVAQAAARFLYVESCGQCPACKFGLGRASGALDHLFDPAHASPGLLDEVRQGAQHAPEANRCYLPVEGSILVPSLMRRFPEEFLDHAEGRGSGSEDIPIAKILDFDEATRTFTYDAMQALKEPDWSYRGQAPARPALPSAPAAKPTRPTHVVVRVPTEVASALSACAEKAGVKLEQQIDEALRDWLRSR